MKKPTETFKSSRCFLRSRTKKWMQQRSTAWRAYLLDPTVETWNSYIGLRNHCTALIREDRHLHQERLAQRFVNNNKLLYKYVNGLRRVKHGVPPLKTSDSMTQTPKEAANVLREQYSSVFHSATVTTALTSEDVQPLICDVSFTPDKVFRKILSVRPNSSPGNDNLHPRMLHAIAEYLSAP